MIVYRSMLEGYTQKNCSLIVGGGILDAPFACSTVTRGVKDAAPYVL